MTSTSSMSSMSRSARAARSDALRDMMAGGVSPRSLLLGRNGVSPKGLRLLRLTARAGAQKHSGGPICPWCDGPVTAAGEFCNSCAGRLGATLVVAK